MHSNATTFTHGTRVAPPGGADESALSESGAERIHIRATDLREAARKAQRLRAAAAAGGAHPPIVVLDVDVLVDADVAWALRCFAGLAEAGTLDTTVRYVGTPGGLVELVADIYSAGIADEVTLSPMCDAMSIRNPNWAAGLHPVPLNQ